MKKKIKDLTIGELIGITKEHRGSSCDYCPLFKIMKLPCDDLCMLKKEELEKIEKDFEEEIEVEEDEKEN